MPWRAAHGRLLRPRFDLLELRHHLPVLRQHLPALRLDDVEPELRARPAPRPPAKRRPLHGAEDPSRVAIRAGNETPAFTKAPGAPTGPPPSRGGLWMSTKWTGWQSVEKARKQGSKNRTRFFQISGRFLRSWALSALCGPPQGAGSGFTPSPPLPRPYSRFPAGSR